MANHFSLSWIYMDNRKSSDSRYSKTLHVCTLYISTSTVTIAWSYIHVCTIANSFSMSIHKHSYSYHTCIHILAHSIAHVCRLRPKRFVRCGHQKFEDYSRLSLHSWKVNYPVGIIIIIRVPCHFHYILVAWCRILVIHVHVAILQAVPYGL